ncbi:CatA-like O-acetyltransferase [Dysgonomonas macrotermitis]|nr:CatA-like O-acetyltransferase [Dysgonomonas macrotermitis]
MKPIFEPIDLDKWERRKYFDYFYHKIKTKYNLTKNIDITRLIEVKEEKGIKIYPTLLYLITRAVNRNKEFRISFNSEGVLGIWNYVNPAYTIFHDDDKTFSDVWSEYSENFAVFYANILTDMETYKDVKEIKARPDQPANFCLISSLPWLSFDGFGQDTFTESSLLFPFIRFGKYFEQDGRILLPLAVFINHAVADGYHTCKLINDIQYLSDHAEEWLTI